ncbi:MAG: C1 family peptidase [Bacteroidales bacterium]|nr:C1 family peptidase [Bacteroidales bacterium]
MKKHIIIAAMLMAAAGIQAGAQNKGGIDASMLQQISKGYEGTAADKAIRNALNTTAINTLSEAPATERLTATDFTHRVKTKGITDQKSSGRCWLFSGLNVLRARAIEKHDLGAFTFSQNYVFFYDQLEKANLFLQGIIDTKDLPFDDRKVDWLFQNPIGDGGQFTGVSNLVTKYGLVPSEIMPETFCSNSTSQMSQNIAKLLRQDGLKLRYANDELTAAASKLKGKKLDNAKAEAAAKLEAMKVDMLKEVYHVLALCLGVPPTEFVWNKKNYTPKSFYEEFVGEDLENNYIMVMNDPTREYGKVYEIDYDRHVYDGQNWLYVNLPIERIKEMAIASIKDNTAMYFSCDVGKFLNRKTGMADINNFDYESLLGVKFTMNKEERIKTHASGSSHAMTLIAVDLDENGQPKKWMVENSWGADSGYKGNIVMTDEWFNEYMFRLVLEKKYVPQDILKMLEQKPIMLPAWDPMFMAEE